MLKALLFDLDGTLSDTDPVHYETWREILLPYGLQIDPLLYKSRFSGRLNQQIVQDFLPQLSPAAGQALSDRKEAAFRERGLTLLRPTHGTQELLRWTDQQQLKRAVVTNAPVENAHFMLQVLGLKEAFPLVVLGDELPVGKPDPLPYTTALNKLEVLPEEAIAFEDSPSGIRSAVAAGIPTIGIASTQAPETLYQLGATLVIPDFTDPQLSAYLQVQTQPSGICG